MLKDKKKKEEIFFFNQTKQKTAEFSPLSLR